MDFTVDAGTILPCVRATSARDAALLAIAEVGDRVQFPIAVTDRKNGERYMFTDGAFPTMEMARELSLIGDRALANIVAAIHNGAEDLAGVVEDEIFASYVLGVTHGSKVSDERRKATDGQMRGDPVPQAIP